jgi:hypothetical protein
MPRLPSIGSEAGKAFLVWCFDGDGGVRMDCSESLKILSDAELGETAAKTHRKPVGADLL